MTLDMTTLQPLPQPGEYTSEAREKALQRARKEERQRLAAVVRRGAVRAAARRMLELLRDWVLPLRPEDPQALQRLVLLLEELAA